MKNALMNVLSVLLWVPVMALRLVMVLTGLVVVPFSMFGDGRYRTPRLWRLWADVEAVPASWNREDMKWWSYLYIPLIGGLAYWSYGHWHPLVTLYLLFASVGILAVVFNEDDWANFWEMAIRNPTGGLNELFVQPIQEPRPNPDNLVYGGVQRSAHRWLRHGVYSEYWYLCAIGKKKFELRIGWKFADGTPGFIVTVQLRYGD